MMEIKQIILVTDGKSNVGGDPVMVAAEAAQRGITVNAIGIMDRHGEDEDTINEVEAIAKAGKGMWESTLIQQLGQTMHVMTQKTVNKTIETIVGKQLREIMGTDLGEIPPKSRGKIIGYMDKLSDEMQVKCCIVMDCSGSMSNKMSTARQSIIELMNSLSGRVGRSEVAVIAYPGNRGEDDRVISDFTEDVQEIKARVMELQAGGKTPTAPALHRAINLMVGTSTTIEEAQFFQEESLLKESLV